MPRSTPSSPSQPPSNQPPPPPRLLTDDDYANMSIWQAMARMTADDWADKELFVYRLSPRTVNRETGDHNYIEKRVEPIDENTIKAMFGGGTFQLILNANTPRRRTVYKATMKIAGKPIFLKDEVTVTKEDPAENPAPAPAGASVEDMIKFARAMKEMGPTEKSDTAQDAMVAALNLVAQGAQKGMEITASQAQKSGMSVDKLFELALQMREKQDPTMKALVEAMLQRLINSPESKAPSLKEKLEELKLIQEQIGANSGKSDSTWSFIAQAAAKAAESLPQLIQAIRERNAPMIVRAQQMAPPAMLPPGPRIQPPFQPQAQTVQAIDPVVLVKAKVIRSFVDGDNGQFVAWMLEKEAPPIYQALKGKTVEEVKAFLSADAALREMIGQEGLEEFIGEVLEYASTTEAPAESVQ